MGRYIVEVYKPDGKRYSPHHCDGSFDVLEDAIKAVHEALIDLRCMGSVIIKDQYRINAHD